jgi:ATP-binding cassette, subfamily A (ABC1), member 3
LPSIAAVTQTTVDDGNNYNSPINLYANGGFVALQNLIDYYIMNELSTTPSGTSRPQSIRFQISQYLQFPTLSGINDSLFSFIGLILPLHLTLAFFWPFSRLIKLLVEEKESKVKESMKMMGLSSSVFWLSWAVFYLFFFALMAICMAIPSCQSLFQRSYPPIIFLFFFLFLVSIFGLVMLTTAFFDNSKTASVFSFLVFLGLFVPYYALPATSVTIPRSTAQLACLSAPLCLALGVSTLSSWESQGLGVHWSNIATEQSPGTSLSLVFYMWMVDLVLYVLLALYLDRVLPSKYGVKLPFYFVCLPSYYNCSCFSERAEVNSDEHNDADKPSSQFFESIGGRAHGPVAVAIQNLTKKFGSKVAVNSLSIDMYEGEIFCLLGSNGAGKSTTIAIMSGMYGATQGDVAVYGDSISTHTAAARSHMGLCSQDNVLFDSLTVAEHLRLFARLRGVAIADLGAQIDSMLLALNMLDKKNSQAHTLSGGQKRKLCVAMAMIGDSKVVFLDEPTSGQLIELFHSLMINQ